VASATIGRRTRTSHFDDENERCCSFEVRIGCRSSAQSTPRSTITLVESGISSPDRSTSRDV
jgi:hypothetical protein